MEQQQGLIAILDALGAADYSADGIRDFLASRNLVLKLLGGKAKDVLGDIDSSLVTVFTFNDTVLITYATGRPAVAKDVEGSVYSFASSSSTRWRRAFFSGAHYPSGRST